MSFPKPYVAIVDVGHGNSTVLCGDSITMVIDCGLGSSLFEFLEGEGIYSIDSVFLSHADQDHIGGLVGILSSGLFEVNNVYVNPDSSKKTDLWDDLLYELSKSTYGKEVKLFTAISHNYGPYPCGEMELKIVGPSPYLAGKSAGGENRNGQKLSTNSLSASFHVIWRGEIIAYLAGDIDQLSLDDLIDHGVNLKAPLLVFPHHGGRSGTGNDIIFTEQLCELVKPQNVIFSIDRNKHKNPRPEIVSTVRTKCTGVRIACTQLSMHCANILPLASPTHLLSLFSEGKLGRKCCSGTFVIKLTDVIEHLPEIKSHKNFILLSAPTSMCQS